jgi:hypothetical protein
MKVLKSLTLFSLLLSSFALKAQLVPPKHFVYTQSFSYTYAKSAFRGNSHPLAINNAKQVYYNTAANLFWGLRKNLQLDLELSYSKSALKDSSFADANKDSTAEGFNKFLIGLKRKLYQKKQYILMARLAYQHPIKTTPKAPLFISLNDFSQDILLTFDNNFKFKRFSLITQTSYIHRFGDIGDQLNINISAPVSLNQKFTLTPGLGLLHTFSGLDIDSPEFSTFPGRLPFDLKRERHITLQQGVNYTFTPKTWGGVVYSQKIWGENSNKGRSLGAYYGRFF